MVKTPLSHLKKCFWEISGVAQHTIVIFPALISQRIAGNLRSFRDLLSERPTL